MNFHAEGRKVALITDVNNHKEIESVLLPPNTKFNQCTREPLGN